MGTKMRKKGRVFLPRQPILRRSERHPGCRRSHLLGAPASPTLAHLSWAVVFLLPLWLGVRYLLTP